MFDNQYATPLSTDSGKLRIAVFTETFLPKIDGVVSILCLMLQRLNELGHKVVLFGPSGGPAEYAGAKIIGASGLPLPLYPELRINVPHYRTWQHLQAFQPDLVHVVHPFFLGVFGLGYARRLNVPVVASFHTHVPRYAEHYGYGWFSPALWAYERFLHNQAHLNLCTSTAMKTELTAHGFRRVRWWKRGIDTDMFCPGAVDPAMRSRLTDGHPDEFLVVNVGRHAPEKSLAGLRDTMFPQEGVRLALIGDGPSHDDLQKHFAGTPTVLPGYMRGQELVAAYRAADAFIFPSTTETFGLVALEAMACRVPVIAARTGGVLDTIQDGVNGLFFEPDEPEMIRNILGRLSKDAALRDYLAENALTHARSRSWRATMDQLVDYYFTAMRLFRQSPDDQPMPVRG